MTSTKITRAELYDLVWQTPMSRLAAEFGVSDVALAKTCARLGVPKPGRGYWAQLGAGMKVTRTPLGKAPADANDWTFVTRVENPVPRPPKQETPDVPIPTDLRDAPDAIRRLGIALGTSTKDQYERLVIAGDREPVIAVTIATHRRALLLLAALASAAQQRGHSLTFSEEGSRKLAIVLDDHVLGVSVIERLEPTDHVLTREEERRAATGYTHGIPKHDYFAGGRLQVVLHDTRGVQSSWSDTKTRTLDKQLGSLILAAEREADRRREQQRAEERRRKEVEQRRAAEGQERKRQRLREARAKYQERLATDLRRTARAWSEAEELRGFISAVRDALPDAAQTERTQAWLRWANAYVDSMDPLVRAEEVPKETNPLDEELSALT